MLVIESNDLSWYPDTGSFEVNASSLEAKYRVDRLDYANGEWYLMVKSARTGNLACFTRMEEGKDRFGKLAFVKFISREHNIYLYINND